MYNIFLKDEDLREGSKYPVLALLNEAANENFTEFLKNLIDGIGSGYNYTTCYFWDELDDFDKENTPQFEGLGIETENGDVVTASVSELAYYMRILNERMHSEAWERKAINSLIDDFVKNNKTCS